MVKRMRRRLSVRRVGRKGRRRVLVMTRRNGIVRSRMVKMRRRKR